MPVPSTSPGDAMDNLPHLFWGGGKLGELMEQHAWDATPFGHPRGWSGLLRSTVSLCLNMSMPTCIYWGPDRCMLYNEAWSVIPGERHPLSLGKPAREVWNSDAWNTLSDRIERVFASGQSDFFENQLLPVHRAGSPQECYFTHTTSAIRADDGSIVGLFNGSMDTTSAVLGKRRAQILSELSQTLLSSRGRRIESMLHALASAAHDLPFSAYFERDPVRPGTARQVAVAGSPRPRDSMARLIPTRVSVGETMTFPFAPETAPTALPSGWRLFRLETEEAESLPRSPWGTPVNTMLLLPVRAAADPGTPHAWLLCGLSPFTPLDAAYVAFLEAIGSLLAAGAAMRRGAVVGNGLSEHVLAQAGFGTLALQHGAPAPELSSTAAALLRDAAPAGHAVPPGVAAALSQSLELDLPVAMTVPAGSSGTLLVQGAVEHRLHHPPRLVGLVGDISAHLREQVLACQNEKLGVVRRLTASLAHEMNNPLESVTNLLYLASLDENLSPSTQQMLQLAEHELERVHFTARQALGFHRDSMGPMRTDIRALILDLLSLVERRPESRGIHIDHSRVRAVSLQCVQGDLRHALSNLLINSFAASAPGSTIRISARLSENRSTGEEVLRISIADRGSGIAAEHRPKIFEPFFTTRGEQGNGLGLWVSRKLVEHHRGTIRFRSRERKPSGSCFMITLPIQIRRSFVQ